MSYLEDSTYFSYKLLEKNSPKKGVLATVGGIFQRADTPNANNRVYPGKLWNGVLKNEDTVGRLKGRQMVGMFGHPSSGQTDPEKISHVITKQELRPDGTVYGEADILDTPAGRVVSTLFNAGVKLGISSRGDGSVEKKGGKDEVQDDFRLETYDFVLKPSTPGAYPGIVEDVNENEKKVVTAIAGLVNSALPQDDNLRPTLAHCQDTLSVLESTEVTGLVESVMQSIQHKLGEQDASNETIQEDGMTAKRNATADPQTGYLPSDDAFAWHQGQVQAAVDQAIAAKEEEVRSVKESLIASQHENVQLRKRISAAEDVITKLQTQVESYQGDDDQESPEMATLRMEYDAAEDLLDAALERLEDLGESERRVSALEGLLEAAITMQQAEFKNEVVEAALERVSEEQAKTLRPMLEECETPEQVAHTFKNLVKVMGESTPRPTTRRRDPLPGAANKLQEDEQKPQSRTQAPRSFVGAVGSRLSMV